MVARCEGYRFRQRAAAPGLRWCTEQLPWRKTFAFPLPPDRMAVAAERWTEYTALSTGCRARRAFLTAFGVTARFTARPGCAARRTLRGISNLEKKPTPTTPPWPMPHPLEDYGAVDPACWKQRC
jgi:hypothetical protein